MVGLFGLAGTLLGDVLYNAKDAVRVVGGVVMIVFGLFMLRLVRIPALYSDTRGPLFAATKVWGCSRAPDEPSTTIATMMKPTWNVYASSPAHAVWASRSPILRKSLMHAVAPPKLETL